MTRHWMRLPKVFRVISKIDIWFYTHLTCSLECPGEEEFDRFLGFLLGGSQHQADEFALTARRDVGAYVTPTVYG